MGLVLLCTLAYISPKVAPPIWVPFAPKTDLMQPCAGKKPVVLVVEDEPLVRAVALAAVAAAACDVIEAANADEAIAILGQRTDMHLIFTDINMP